MLGALSAKVDNGNGTFSYSATFTPAAGSGNTRIAVDSNKFTDAAGNSNTVLVQQTGSFDTVRPEVAVSLPNGHSGALKAGESVELTLTFTEEVRGLSLSDIVVPEGKGRVSNLVQSASDAKVYTVTYTPAVSLNAQSVVLSIGNAAFTDAAGNANADGVDGNNAVTLSVDTLVPTASGVTITGKDSLGAAKVGSLTVGDHIDVEVSFSEAVVLSNASQISYAINVGGFTKFAQYSGLSQDGTKMTLRYTVASGDVDTAGGITVAANALGLGASGAIADAAGNAADVRVSASGSGNGPATNTIAVDTPVPEVSVQR
jgi:hypothetical protein